MKTQENAREFIALTTSAALKQVKASFGPDAIILSQQNIGNKVRILALPAYAVVPKTHPNEIKHKVAIASVDDAIEFEPEVQQEDYSSKEANTYSRISSLSRQENSQIPDEVSSYIKNELESIKDLIKEQQIKEKQQKANPADFNVHQLAMMRTLHKVKFHSTLVNELLTDLPTDCGIEASWHYVINKLTDKLVFDNGGFSAKRTKTFLGPSGVGKSLLLAKLLIYFANRPLQQNFSIIFVNNSNLKVLEESKVYARLFNVPTYYAESLEELESAYRKSFDKKHVFIDFPAHDFGCAENNFYLEFIQKYREEIDNTLVVSSHCDFEYINRLYNAIQPHLIDALSITKLDENNAFEEIISFLISKQLPLRNLSYGNLNFTNGYSSRLIFAEKQYIHDYFSNRLINGIHS